MLRGQETRERRPRLLPSGQGKCLLVGKCWLKQVSHKDSHNGFGLLQERGDECKVEFFSRR